MNINYFNPDHPETRKLINQHKQRALRDIYKQSVRNHFVENPHLCLQAYVEQIADSELYAEAYKEGIKKMPKACECIYCDGTGINPRTNHCPHCQGLGKQTKE